MATIVLGFGAQALAGAAGWGTTAVSIAGSVGALAGSFLDSKLFAPKLRPPVRPEIDDWQVNTASEGTPKVRCAGPENRTAAACFWTSGILEVKNTTKVGGAKGAPAVTEYTYYSSVALAICQGTANKISKVWADGKLLYDLAAANDVTSTLISIQPYTLWKRVTVKPGAPAVVVQEKHMYVTSPSGGPDLTKFVAGSTVTISGCSNGGNNGTFTIYNSFTRANGDTVIDVINTSAVAETAGASIRLYQPLPPFDSRKVQSVTFYPGNTTQNPDPVMEAYEGAGNVPAHRRTSYVLLERLALQDYGNRIPFFQVLVEKDSSKTIADAIGDRILEAGLSASDYDVSRVTGTLRGMVIPGPEAPLAAIERLQQAFNLLRQEADGKLVFFPRVAPATITVAAGDLAAHDLGQDAPRPYDVVDPAESDLPAEVLVAYVDPANGYQRGEKRARRREKTIDRVDSYDLGLVIDGTTAQAVAERILWTEWSTGRRVQLSLPPSYRHIAQGDVLLVPQGSDTIRVLVTEAVRGANYRVEVRGVIEEEQALI